MLTESDAIALIAESGRDDITFEDGVLVDDLYHTHPADLSSTQAFLACIEAVPTLADECESGRVLDGRYYGDPS